MTNAQAQWITLGVVLALTAAAIGYDVTAIRAWGVDASISRVMRRLFGACPTLFVATVFWLGILVGHIWLPAE